MYVRLLLVRSDRLWGRRAGSTGACAKYDQPLNTSGLVAKPPNESRCAGRFHLGDLRSRAPVNRRPSTRGSTIEESTPRPSTACASEA